MKNNRVIRESTILHDSDNLSMDVQNNFQYNAILCYSVYTSVCVCVEVGGVTLITPIQKG